MRKLPPVLSAFIRFVHAERGIRASLTEETLEAVVRWTPDYLASLKGPPRSRFQGARDLARFAAGFARGDDLFDDDVDNDDLDKDDDFDAGGVLDLTALVADFHRRLEAEMGGPEAIAALDCEPLPDEPFDWPAVPDGLRPQVGVALAAIDQVCDSHLDVEMCTIRRRLLARVVAADSGAFRRSEHHDRLAAGVVAVGCYENGAFRRGRNSLTAYGPVFSVDNQKPLAEAMGVPAGTVSSRAQTVRNALDLREGRFDAELAHSTKRQWYLDQYEHTAHWLADDPDEDVFDDDDDL